MSHKIYRKSCLRNIIPLTGSITYNLPWLFFLWADKKQEKITKSIESFTANKKAEQKPVEEAGASFDLKTKCHVYLSRRS